MQSADLRKYIEAGRAAGCPSDQMMNFVKAGIVLTPRQLAMSAAARACDLADGPTKLGVGGSRGGGKSFWAICQVGADDCQRFPGLKFLLLRKIGKTNKEAFEDLRRRAFSHLPHDYQPREGHVQFENGSRIFLGNYKDEKDIEQYLGIEYDGVIIEESTTLSPKKVRDIRGSIRTSKKGWRPREYHTTNPGGIGHVQFKNDFILPFRRGIERDTRFIPAKVDDNPHVNKEYRKNLEGYTGWQRRAWLDGDWDIEIGQYFSNFAYDVHVKPHEGFDLPTTWQVWGSLDHGLVHYTTFYLHGRDSDGHIWELDEHAERFWVPEQHSEAIHNMLGRWEIPYSRLLSIEAGHDCFQRKQTDDGSIGTLSDQYRQHGINLVRANVDRVNGALEYYRRLGNEATRDENEKLIPHRITVLDSCPRLIECLPSLQRDPGRPEDVLKVDCDSDTGDGGDDPYDGSRYGIMKFSAHRAFNTSPSVVGPPRDFSTYKVM